MITSTALVLLMIPGVGYVQLFNVALVYDKGLHFRRTASSILVSLGESLRFPSSGSPSWPRLSSPSNGSSGVTHLPSHTPLANTSAIWRTLVSEMSSQHHQLVPPRSPIFFSLFIRACSPLSQLLLPSELLLSVVVCFLVWFSCSFGQPSSMTQLRAGHGTLPVGFSRWEGLISLVEPQCIFPLAVLLSPTLSCWASAEVTV